MSRLLVRNHPFPTLADFVFQTGARENRLPRTPGPWIPPVNILELEKSFSIEMAAPGFRREAFQIQVQENQLVISGQDPGAETAAGRYTRREYACHAFRRVFNLPDTVETGKISAAYTDGILRVELPKKEQSPDSGQRLIPVE